MGHSLAGRDLLSIADLTSDEIIAVLDLADAAKAGRDLGSPLAGRSLALIFQRPSNRTRVSFEVAIHRLGGHPIALFNPEVQLGERESAADISRILDRYADGIVARLVSHRDLVTIAGAASSPVINALTDAEHPCQVLADCMTVRSVTGRLTGATVAYIGDGNNVCTSWIYAAALLGVNLRVICPPGYEPSAAVVERAARLRGPGTGFEITHEAAPALRDTEIIYTDVWTSMGQETEQQRRREDFAYLQVNDGLVGLAPPRVRVMHCLPAHRGEEITDAVIDGPQSVVFDQAEHRLWVQQALLSLIYAGDGHEAAA
jgi:ornithine carbamoyltransferase